MFTASFCVTQLYVYTKATYPDVECFGYGISPQGLILNYIMFSCIKTRMNIVLIVIAIYYKAEKASICLRSFDVRRLSCNQCMY